MIPPKCLITFLFILICNTISYGIAKYEEGSIEIGGIKLLQDHINSANYYYIPNGPRIALKEDKLAFACHKYISPENTTINGGLFHAMFEFILTNTELNYLKEELKKIKPNANIVGPVKLVEDGRNSIANFRIISSILTSKDNNNPFDAKVISSGKTSVENSKAAIAVQLNPEGTTLLWESFHTATSDVSIVLEGYFEAYLKAYQASIRADLKLVYEHFNRPANRSKVITQKIVHGLIDSLCRNGLIDIEIIDKSNTLDFNAKALEQIINIITQKISTKIFETSIGWTKLETQEFELQEKPARKTTNGLWRHKVLPYKSVKRLRLKDKKRIRNFKFYLNLEQSSTIKVPIYAARNLGVLFENKLNQNSDYFSVIPLDDPTYKEREVYFQVDGNYLNSFKDIINHVGIRVQKKDTSNALIYSNSLEFNRKEILSGINIKSLNYKRGANKAINWQKLEYQVAWNLMGIDTILLNPSKGWLSSNSAAISIAPPFEKIDLEIDADYESFEKEEINSIRIKFGSILLGQPRQGKAITLRAKDSNQPDMVTLYRDFNKPIVYEIAWYYKKGVKKEKLKILENNQEYLLLVPPIRE